MEGREGEGERERETEKTKTKIREKERRDTVEGNNMSLEMTSRGRRSNGKSETIRTKREDERTVNERGDRKKTDSRVKMK